MQIHENMAEKQIQLRNFSICAKSILHVTARKSYMWWRNPYVICIDYKITPYKIPQYTYVHINKHLTPIYCGDITVDTSSTKLKYPNRDALDEDLMRLEKIVPIESTL